MPPTSPIADNSSRFQFLLAVRGSRAAGVSGWRILPQEPGHESRGRGLLVMGALTVLVRHQAQLLAMLQPGQVWYTLFSAFGMALPFYLNQDHRQPLKRALQGWISTKEKRQENAKRKRANRRLVPCACQLCGNVRLVTQDERQRHLKTDRLRAAQNTARAEAVIRHLAQQLPAGTASCNDVPNASDLSSIIAPYVPLSISEGHTSIRDLELQAATVRDTFSTFTSSLLNGSSPTYDPPSTHSDRPEGPVGEQSQHIEAVEQSSHEPVQSFDPIGDDNWEDGPMPPEELISHASEHPPPPPPPPPLPTAVAPPLQADMVPCKPVALFIPPSKKEENTPDPFLNFKTTTPPSPPPPTCGCPSQ
ncbi:hypothetical protein NMY22_g67 [Coprinellus aureogranulatus]|nr:hypothetical protein NMY22_g67 [Coprinellus aureogranulatus]